MIIAQNRRDNICYGTIKILCTKMLQVEQKLVQKRKYVTEFKSKQSCRKRF